VNRLAFCLILWNIPASAGFIFVAGINCPTPSFATSGTLTCAGNSLGQGFAQASIFAESFGSLSVQARASGYFGATAQATASYSQFIDYGPSPGVVTGVYGIGAAAGSFSITQGGLPTFCSPCITFTLVTNYTGTPIQVAGSVTATAVDFNFDQEGFFLQSLTFTPAPTPEPGTGLMFGGGLLGLVIALRCRHHGRY
jgi:hypothetical protein